MERYLRTEDEIRNFNRTPRGREAREAATGLFVKAKLDETRTIEADKMSRLRALRLAKEAAETTSKAELKKAI
jgi:hypothetical protein